MARLVTLNGVVHSIPDPGDTDYAAALSDYFEAIPAGVFQKSGGSFTLTAEADFGGSFGLSSLYYKSRTANPAATGILRLAKTDKVSWRNNANTADLPFGIGVTDGLEFNGSPIAGTGTVTSVTLTQPAAGITLTNSGVSQTTVVTSTVALANDLAAVESLAATGLATRTAADTWAARTITVGAGLTIVDGSGVSGNPLVGIASSRLFLIDVQTFTSTGTWTKPAGTTAARTYGVGGGGGSGGAPTTGAGAGSAGGGGGGGGYCEEFLTSGLGATEAVTIGAAGTAGAAGAAGGAGGTSSFGSHWSAGGGSGGAIHGPTASTVVAGSVSGGTATGATINIVGGQGSVFGTYSYADTFISLGGSGGASRLSSVNNNQTGGVAVAGTAFGGGALGSANGASSTARTGAAGAAGIVVVESYGV